MGLRNGEALNALCPGKNGPSDIDHVVHNMHTWPYERLTFLEYKDEGAELRMGQALLRRSLIGDWQEDATGRCLSIRYHVLYPSDKHKLEPIVSWLWPEQNMPDWIRKAAGL